MAVPSLGQVAAAYEQGAQAERDRIDLELYDGVIHSLFGVGLSLQAAAAEAVDEYQRKRLEDAIDGLDQAIRDLREHLFTPR